MVKKGKNTRRNNITTKKHNFANNQVAKAADPKKRVKPESRALYKRFDTFDQAAQEILSIPGWIGEELCKYLKATSCAEGEVTIDDMGYAIASMFRDNLPDIQANRNQFWTMSMSLDRCFLKTGKYVGIGYLINKKYEDGAHIITSVDMTFVSYNVLKTVDEINYLNEKAWTKENPKTAEAAE